ncbi:SIS domain-containing protein [Colwellia sp. 6_MG-2023]|uniref:SIS domain-containing protein n=1 Tax=Colwellia sp. 6_MG-2023 TaxID=3062676 RepID=UPI0026E3112E|nr:SIS domain-containing protein [Colwellia sp. 6_MG-2023]MDO6486229.1 SIS domain-containing protein [Colwellia sp. 6_MG-2023]
MNEYLSISTESLKENNAFWTAKEITQQPECWSITRDLVRNNDELAPWLESVLAKENLRIILTGAGTSAYVGEALAPHLTKACNRLVEAVSTTDIVSSPDQYLISSIPTLLVSYGRSGDSPESVAAIKLADQVLDDCYHLVITCNEDGSLARYANESEKAFSVLMPSQSLDQSFAMTSSFTSMYVATLAIFAADDKQLAFAIDAAQHVIETLCPTIQDISQLNNTKQIFLGSAALSGMAKEASLKYLELTAGKIGCFCESSLGFRHGPKSNVDEKSIIIMLDSNDEYISHYDNDMVNELTANAIAMKVVTLKGLLPEVPDDLSDVWLGLPYIVICQILSFYKSLSLNFTPDNPCPTGEVNRVVQGVNLYPFG